MQVNERQEELLKKYNVDPKTGLTTDEAAVRREKDGSFNVVTPPLNCPPWVCCLLPCIKHVPSMVAYNQMKPDDAEVMRNGKWTRYDASSLVTGDLIRLEEGDVVPADCIVLPSSIAEESIELLVDVRGVTGEDKPRSVSNEELLQLYWGGTVVQGSCLAIVTAIGPNTLVAKLIADGNFPVKNGRLPNVSKIASESDEVGISLVSSKSSLS